MNRKDGFRYVTMELTKPTEELSIDEVALLENLCLPYKLICQDLDIKPEALRHRIFRLMEKMGVENRTALVVKSLKLGIININQLKVREFSGEVIIS